MTCFLVFSTALVSYSQDNTIQAFTYDSTSRSMMVDFQDRDQNDYEKILMYYSMRCHDGLVSNGSNPNRGCGEWDYTCNTYLVDSSKVDSFIATSPDYVIGGYPDPTFDYSTSPTYRYYQNTARQVVIKQINTAIEHSVQVGMESLPTVSDGSKQIKHQFIYNQAELAASGLTTGNVLALKIPVTSGQGEFSRLRVSLGASSVDALDGRSLTGDQFKEVYNDNFVVSGSEIHIPFYQPYKYTTGEHVIVQLSYEGYTGSDLVLEGNSSQVAHALHINGESNTALANRGDTRINLPNGFDFSSKEITVSFWYKGADSHPKNSTILEGLGTGGERQLNVHLPWSNGEVYWDCGNEGSGYDRLSKAVDIDNVLKKWNHWTFTKNANNGVMRIFINGESFAGVNGQLNDIDIKNLRIGGSLVNNYPTLGELDDVRIFDIALTDDEIKSTMNSEISSGHDLYNNLVLNLNFNELSTGQDLADHSSVNNSIEIDGGTIPYFSLGAHQRNNAMVSADLPNMTFIEGDYDIVTTEIEVLDSIENSPFVIKEYGVVNSERVLLNSYLYYLSGSLVVLDEDDNIVNVEFRNPEGTITIGELTYYSKRPSRFEIMSFVTPYGLGLDLGIEGETWVFDVSDFGPILKGQKRLFLSGGGQNQEDMDIRFVFIPGTPVRDVHEIQQIWPTTAESNSRIISNQRFEERSLSLSSTSSNYRIRTSITGHGQEGEFIPRNHHLNINGGPIETEWSVWKECSDNPIYPQGGTWIYDRAGWCPGAPTDVHMYDLRGVSPGDQISIDYGMEVAGGDSRYYVNSQLVSYGLPNYEDDAELVDIITPSAKIEHDRFNPHCGEPRIMIRNTGSNDLTELDIEYGIEGLQAVMYTWTGDLSFLEEEEVTLPALNFGSRHVGHNFFVKVLDPTSSGKTTNNELSTLISAVPKHKSDIVVELKTNNFPNETRWRVFDFDGNVLASRLSGMVSNRLYQDTIRGLDGCYRLEITDTDDDGISWWANQAVDGNGYVRIRNVGGAAQVIATDFGRFINYEFTTENYTSVNESEELSNEFLVSPNPGAGDFLFSYNGIENVEEIRIYNQQGQQVLSHDLDDDNLNQVKLNMKDKNPGRYIAELISKNQTFNTTFIKH